MLCFYSSVITSCLFPLLNRSKFPLVEHDNSVDKLRTFSSVYLFIGSLVFYDNSIQMGIMKRKASPAKTVFLFIICFSFLLDGKLSIRSLEWPSTRESPFPTTAHSFVLRSSTIRTSPTGVFANPQWNRRRNADQTCRTAADTETNR